MRSIIVTILFALVLNVFARSYGRGYRLYGYGRRSHYLVRYQPVYQKSISYEKQSYSHGDSTYQQTSYESKSSYAKPIYVAYKQPVAYEKPASTYQQQKPSYKQPSNESPVYTQPSYQEPTSYAQPSDVQPASYPVEHQAY
jgi:hypothetical protein